MRSHIEYLWFNTKKKREFVNITNELERALEKAQIKEGLMLASAMHITAGVYINDAEDGLIADIAEWLEKLAPFREDYRHHRTGEDNGDAHLKNLLIGHQVLVPVTNGKLDLGPWQQVYYAEFDGQRRKRYRGRPLVVRLGLRPSTGASTPQSRRVWLAARAVEATSTAVHIDGSWSACFTARRWRAARPVAFASLFPDREEGTPSDLSPVFVVFDFKVGAKRKGNRSRMRPPRSKITIVQKAR